MKKGYTLVEILTVIAISSIIGGIVTEFIIKTMSNNRQVEAQTILQTQLNMAGDKFNRVARSATIVIGATATNFKIRGYPSASDTAPSEINFYLDGSVVRYSVIPPSGSPPNYTYNPNDAKVYLLVSKVTNTTGNPLFRYYDQNDSLLSSPVVISSVRMVEFIPSALDQTNILKTPLVVVNKATLRNFKIYY